MGGQHFCREFLLLPHHCFEFYNGIAIKFIVQCLKHYFQKNMLNSDLKNILTSVAEVYK